MSDERLNLNEVEPDPDTPPVDSMNQLEANIRNWCAKLFQLVYDEVSMTLQKSDERIELLERQLVELTQFSTGQGVLQQALLETFEDQIDPQKFTSAYEKFAAEAMEGFKHARREAADSQRKFYSTGPLPSDESDSKD